MSKKIIVAAILIIIVGIVWFGLSSRTSKDLVNPQVQAPSETPSPVSPQAPKTLNFDSSTDLQAELEKVNPQVLDSDFE